MLDLKQNNAHNHRYLELQWESNDDKREIVEGLRRPQKSIHPKYFYNTYGSELFEQITRLPEYYPTTAEVDIFNNYAEDIANHCGRGDTVIEPGSGNSEKIRYLLDSLKPDNYVPIDIAGDFLNEAAQTLAEDFQWLDVHAICADFHKLQYLPPDINMGRKLVFYPGSTIGNMTPHKASEFLLKIRQWLSRKDSGLLIGIDLHKSTKTLEAAYNDSEGVTAEFNSNILNHVNKLAEANFDHQLFEHRAIYNTKERRIEMYLDAKTQQVFQLDGQDLRFEKGESILTEYSYKYTQADIEELAENSGFRLNKIWLDNNKLFSVSHLSPA